MVTYAFLIAGLAALAHASPLKLAARDCTEGLYNCLDGKTYQQCVSGGTWSVTMPVAPGTTCNVGISANPWSAADPPSPASSQAAPPATSAAPQSTTSTPSTTVPAKSGPPATSTTFSVQASTSAPQPAQSSAAGSSSSSPSCPGVESMDKWQTWDQMVSKYATVMGTSCQSSWQVANNSPDETQAVFDAIKAQSGTIDPRFILAIVIQESSGCVRVPTTNNGVRNPGLMQDSNGSHSCNDGGSVQNPCSADEINGMIQDGVSGGSDNYKQALSTAQAQGYTGAMQYAVAARVYNSGSFTGDLCNGITATASYVSDVMQRLEGLKL